MRRTSWSPMPAMAELGLSSALVLSGGCCQCWLGPQASHSVMEQWVTADAVRPGRDTSMVMPG